jgi:hypothetical protein
MVPCLSPRCLEFTAKKKFKLFNQKSFPTERNQAKKGIFDQIPPKGLQIPPLLKNPPGTFALEN